MSSPPPPGYGPPSHSFFTLKEPPKQGRPESVTAPQISISYSADAMKGESVVRPALTSSSADGGGGEAAVTEWGYIHDPKWTVDYTRPVPQASSIEIARELGDMSMVGIAPAGPRSRTPQLHPRVRGTEPAPQPQQSRTVLAPPPWGVSAPTNLQTSPYVPKPFVPKAALQMAPEEMKKGSRAGTAASESVFSVLGTGFGEELASTSLRNLSPLNTDRSAKDERKTPSPRPTLTIPQATEMLRLATKIPDVEERHLNSLVFSVAFYSPMGSFIPPLQSIEVTLKTSLRKLVLSLQDQLRKNLNLARSDARLLVQSIEAKFFDKLFGEGQADELIRFPRIEGWLSGARTSIRDKVLDLKGNGVVDRTYWVAWDWESKTDNGQGNGESGDFWDALVQRMLFDDYFEITHNNYTKYPMLKIRTVVKIGDTLDDPKERGNQVGVGGGHYFHLPYGAFLPPSKVAAVNDITPRGSFASEGGKDAPKDDGLSAQNHVTEAIDNLPTLVTRLSSLKHGRGSPDSFTSTPPAQPRKKLHTHNSQHTRRRQSFEPQPLQLSLGSFMPSTAPQGNLDAAMKELQDLNLNGKRSEGSSASNAEKRLAARLWKKLNQERKQRASAAVTEDINFEEETRINMEPTAPKTTTFPMHTNDEIKKGAPTNKGEKDYYARVLALGSWEGDSRSFWVEKGGYPKNLAVEVDPEHNWEMYQCWGEQSSDPGYEDRKTLHEWFSLRHVPFYGPVCRPWNQDVMAYRTEDGDEDEVEEESPYQMVPYEALDPKLIAQHILESVNTPISLPLLVRKYWEDQAITKGLSEVDDDTFFPASNPDFVRKEQASKVFQARTFKNPTRIKKFDISTVLNATERRVSSNQSKYLDSLAATAEKASEVYENMLAAATLRPDQTPSATSTTTRTFNLSHAAADNVFQSTMKGVGSFTSLSKQDFRPNGGCGPGFYELSKGVANHTPAKDADSFVSDLNSESHQMEANEYSGENENHTGFSATSFGEFSAMANEFMADQNAGVHEQSNAMASGHHFTSSEDIMRGHLLSEDMASANHFGGNSTGEGTGVNQAHMSYETTLSDFNGLNEYRNSYANHMYPHSSTYPNFQGWTSMNTAGATYNSFGGQNNAFNSRTPSMMAPNRGFGTISQYNHQYNQYGVATPPVNRTQSRFFNPIDTSRSTPGHERFAFNNMAIPSSSSSHPAAGSFVNPFTTPTNPNHPQVGSFIHGASGPRSRTHGLHLGSNPPSSSRARRPIPIMVPHGNRGKQFQLPSPTRLAINYGAGPNPASLGMSTSTDAAGNAVSLPYVRRTPSPEKKAFQKASMAAFGAAIESAFNGPKSSPSAAGKKV
ncbi:hypothetical protein VTL71DRAFT_1267 [Oculimacula yallundae]|uniref:Uncharacterized protein n=1 Tax=Oculimacula yallundae TaxID=86028 RepID=A0ABR4CA84_9HELO